MSKLLIASEIKESYLPKLQAECADLKSKGVTPKLAVVLVGENKASLSYIKSKENHCSKIGAEFELIKLDKNIKEEDFINKVKELDENKLINGIIVQLPVSGHLKHIDIANLVSHDKDVDGFGAESIFDIFSNNTENTLVSCTPKGILKIFEHYKIDLFGKNITVIGRSSIVGKPLGMLLTNKHATVTLCHSKTKNIKEITSKSDIIILAIGVAKYLDESFLSTNKDQIIIDVGINRDESGKLCGDADFENIKDKVSMITPVPGGVGPMTVISLVENLIIATKNQMERGLL